MKHTVSSPFTGRTFERKVPDRLQPLDAVAPAAPKTAKNNPDAKAPDTRHLSNGLASLLRSQSAYRWLLPQLASITPQYIEATLRGALAGNHLPAWELFDLMLDSWPELAACSQELIEGVQRKKLIFEPYHEEDEEPTDEATERMKVVSAALRNMTPDPAADENDLDGTIKDILSAWFVGQVVLETCWDAGNGSEKLNTITTTVGDIIAPRATFWVHPVCYAWNRFGRLGLRAELNATRTTTKQAKKVPAQERRSDGGWNSTTWQAMPTSVDEFPKDHFLIGVHKAKSGTALGGAPLRVLAFWWCAANFSAEWLLNLAQLFGLPIRWANFDLNAPQETIDAICAMLEKMGSAGWGAFPAGTNLQLHEATKTGDNSPQGELLDRADRYARMVVLGQTMTGGQGTTGKGGGQAFGTVEADVKDDRIDAAGKFACGVINKQMIPAILRANYGNAKQAPVVRLLQKDEATVQDAQIVKTLADAGMKFGVNHLRKKFDFPEPDDDEETIGGKPESVTPITTDLEDPDHGNTPAEATHRSCRHAAPLDASANDKLVSNVLEELTGVEVRWLAGVKPAFLSLAAKALDGSVSDADFVRTLERAQREMPELFDKLNADAIADAMERATGAAAANGALRGHMQRHLRVSLAKLPAGGAA